MTKPSIPTIKRLYAVSKDNCAFPKCTNSLVDKASGKVTGRICHIKGKSPGGPRYDISQSEEERHGFNNLILMCPIHHDVIDSDEESYTTERLLKIKNDHENCATEIWEVPDTIAINFINNMDSNTINNGSIILNQNQMGGQVAHSITNVGPQPRQISQNAVNMLILELKKYPSENFVITCLMNDSETYQTASMIEQILKLATWSNDGIRQGMFSGLPRNIIIKVPQEKPSLNILMEWFINIGFKPQGVLDPQLESIEIIVGSIL